MIYPSEYYYFGTNLCSRMSLTTFDNSNKLYCFAFSSVCVNYSHLVGYFFDSLSSSLIEYVLTAYHVDVSLIKSHWVIYASIMVRLVEFSWEHHSSPFVGFLVHIRNINLIPVLYAYSTGNEYSRPVRNDLGALSWAGSNLLWLALMWEHLQIQTFN